MKSLSGKLGIILIGLTIFTYAEVRGEDWKFFSWAHNGTFFWYDTQGVAYHPNEVVRVWIKLVTDDKILEKIKSGAKLKESELDQMVSEKDYEKSLIEINCVKKTYGCLKRYKYDSIGFLKSGALESAIGDIQPNSIAETLYKTLCK
jgi:hypothetical protein